MWERSHGLLLAHYAERKLMHEAALKTEEDRSPLVRACGAHYPRNLAIFTTTLPRETPRLHEAVLDEILVQRVKSIRDRQNQCGVKCNMSAYSLKRDQPPLPPILDFE